MIKHIFSFLHKLCEVHVVMNIITILAIGQFFTDINLWIPFIMFYSVASIVVSVSRAAYFIIKGKPDDEFRMLVRMIEGRN